MSYQLKFGTFTFPKGIYPAAEDANANVPAAKLPRADGAVQRIGYLDKRRVTVEGAIIHDVLSLGTFRTQLDNIKSAIRQGPANLSLEPDRYYRSAQAVTSSFGYRHTYGRIVDSVRIDFETGDPFQYSTATSTATASGLTSGATFSVTAGGNAYAQPAFALTMAPGGSVTATVSATASGEVFTLRGSVTAAQTVTIDSLAETVVSNGLDITSLFDGVFPRLLGATANPIVVSWGGAVSVTAVAVTWINRWY